MDERTPPLIEGDERGMIAGEAPCHRPHGDHDAPPQADDDLTRIRRIMPSRGNRARVASSGDPDEMWGVSVRVRCCCRSRGR